MSGLTLRWPAEDLWQRLSPRWPGFSVEVVAQIDSTNAELMRRARGPEFLPTVLVAEHQTAGRGRMGRTWHGQPGDGLMMSVGLGMRPKSWQGLSLVVGTVLAQTLDPDGRLGVGLKWPNDLWLDTPNGPRKLAGILIETAMSSPDAGRVVMGIGLNLKSPQTPPGADAFRTPPVGLNELGDARTAPQCLAELVPALFEAMALFEQEGWLPWRSRYHARDVLKGQALVLSDGRSGMGLGVDEQGALRLATAQGEVAVHADEVSVRSAPLAPQAPRGSE